MSLFAFELRIVNCLAGEIIFKLKFRTRWRFDKVCFGFNRSVRVTHFGKMYNDWALNVSAQNH